MKYIDNLVEWGDKLFRRDTMEIDPGGDADLHPRRQHPRPAAGEDSADRREAEPLTFQQMRSGLNLFSNFEVRAREPAGAPAIPDQRAAGSRAAPRRCSAWRRSISARRPTRSSTRYWDTVADRLFKIRNCMNIQGIVRQLALFDPPIDPGLLVRAAAAGVDLGSVIASLNAPPPHYRFRFLLDRAVRLAEEIRSFGAMTLRVLERKDAEGAGGAAGLERDRAARRRPRHPQEAGQAGRRRAGGAVDSPRARRHAGHASQHPAVAVDERAGDRRAGVAAPRPRSRRASQKASTWWRKVVHAIPDIPDRRRRRLQLAVRDVAARRTDAGRHRRGICGELAKPSS